MATEIERLIKQGEKKKESKRIPESELWWQRIMIPTTEMGQL